MIFQHTIDKVLSSEKTQTRRIVKPGDVLVSIENPFGGYKPVKVVNPNMNAPYGYERWVIGKTYAMQSGRGVKAEGRIRITDIRREDVRNISIDDYMAEGFTSRLEFLETWVKMHDPQRVFYYEMGGIYHQWRGKTRKWEVANYQSVLDCLKDRPAERYQAWAITFELVKESDHASK